MPALLIILKSLLWIALVIGLVLLALTMFQNRLLYYPTPTPLAGFAPAGLEPWPTTKDLAMDGESNQQAFDSADASNPVLGLISQPSDGQMAKGTVIVFHGNAGHAGHRLYYAQALEPHGLRTILAEYPGYGPRPGTPGEPIIVDDAVEILRLAHALYGEPVWLVGESLGAGVAAAVGGREPSLVQGVMLITPWNRLSEVASHHYPFLPVRWLLKSEYDSARALERFDGPKLVVVAGQDTIVPAELGLDLHRQLQGQKRLIKLANAGHSDWPGHASPSFWPDAVKWLGEARAASP